MLFLHEERLISRQVLRDNLVKYLGRYQEETFQIESPLPGIYFTLLACTVYTVYIKMRLNEVFTKSNRRKSIPISTAISLSGDHLVSIGHITRPQV